MALIELTTDVDAFYLDDENIIRVYSLNSETKIQYADVESGVVKTTTAIESVSTIGDGSNILIALTETASGATFYLNSNKISSVLTEGTGSLIYFDVLGKKFQVIVDETKVEVEALFPIIPNGTFLPLAGGTLTGDLDMNGNIIQLSDVDGDISSISTDVDGNVIITSDAATLIINCDSGIEINTGGLSSSDSPITVADEVFRIVKSGEGTVSIGTASLTGFRVALFPDKDITVAGLDDLDSYLPLSGGTVENLIITAPTYADDTAAGAGGLTTGMVYKTATGELRIKV